MQDSSSIALPWSIKVLLLGMCALLALSSAGLGFLLFQHRELTDDLVRLDAQMQVLSQSCSLQAGILQTASPAGEAELLHRSRRSQAGEAARRKEQEDVLMMMTYSMVPVRHSSA